MTTPSSIMTPPSDRPKLLDLFSGAGGAGYGYKLAGFHVTGVDNHPMPRYAGDRFIQADALEYLAAHGHEYDAIHASPPCQIHSQITRTAGTLKNHEDLIEPTRQLLIAIGKPYVIENVIGAPLQDAVKLCGTMFGLLVLRHRLFETSPPMPHFGNPPCKHERITVNAGRKPDREKNYHSVVGHFPDMEFAQEAMGIDWMSRDELSQAIPPAYTEYIGKHLLATLPIPRPFTLRVRPRTSQGYHVRHRAGLRMQPARRYDVDAPTPTEPPMQEAYWLYTQPGGWNFVSRVPCYVVRHTEKRCKILAKKQDGSFVERWVKPEKLIDTEWSGAREWQQ